MAKAYVFDAAGKEIYDVLIDIFDKTPKEASLALNNVGIKGITYVGQRTADALSSLTTRQSRSTLTARSRRSGRSGMKPCTG